LNPVAPRSPTRKYAATLEPNTCVASITWNTAEAIEPHSTARKPARPASTPFFVSSGIVAVVVTAAASRELAPTLSTSAQATPSGYGKSEPVTSARRNGIEYITPSVPPSAQISMVSQYGKPAHQPTMTRPGNTKMIADRHPADEAMVCTMLFSWMVASPTLRRMAIEITAAGIDVANVRPALRPK